MHKFSERRRSLFRRALAPALLMSLLAVTPASAGEWRQSEKDGALRWWFDFGGGKFATGWNWLDGDKDGVSERYYFDGDGWLLTATVTPDGYTVNENGALTDDGNVRIMVDFVPGEAAPEKEEPAPTAQAEAPAEAPGQAPTEAPAEAPTEAPIEAPTEAPVAASEQAQPVAESSAAAPENGPGAAGPGVPADVPAAAASQVQGSDIVNFARQYVGKLRYVYGGSSLESGVDCSAFTMLVFQQFGKTLPRGTGDQLASGTRISAEEAVPGDLVFWARSGHIYHVGILSGNGKFIHASNTERGWVFEDNLYDMPAPAGYARY